MTVFFTAARMLLDKEKLSDLDMVVLGALSMHMQWALRASLQKLRKDPAFETLTAPLKEAESWEVCYRLGRDLLCAKPGDEDNWAMRELWAPAFEPDRFGSATGSGDSSIAGLLSAFIRGLNIEQSLKYATCCGFQNVRALDSVSGIKSWDETTAMLRDDMPMVDAHIDAAGWTWNEDHGLWVGPKDRLAPLQVG